MCRLLAIRAQRPVPVARALEGLAALSHEHKDGWGLCRFDDLAPTCERSLQPAHACARFTHLSSALTTQHLMAHIRLASVGGVTERNAHPFSAGGWAFMHNGTVQRFQANAHRVDALIDPRWRAQVQGETDSERCFALFLTLLPEDPSLDDAARALAGTMRAVAEACDRDPAEPRSAMNFLASNGRFLIASRRGRTLFHGVEDGLRVIASERLWTGPQWREVPEDGLVGIDDALGLREWSLATIP